MGSASVVVPWLLTVPVDEVEGAEADAPVDETAPSVVVEAVEAEGADGPRFVPRLDAGFGLGLAHVAATGGPYQSRSGVGLDLRAGIGLSHRTQLDLLTSLGILYPERTVWLAAAALDLGGWTLGAFASVTDWARTPTGVGLLDALKWTGTLVAYSGLGIVALGVPLLFALSPVASVGQGLIGPVLRVHTGLGPPDAFVEVGAGGLFYATPDSAGLGWGPVLGIGTQLGGGLVLGTRWTVSPPALHVDLYDLRSTILSGSLYIGF